MWREAYPGSRRESLHFTSSSLHKESCGERYRVSNRLSSLIIRKRLFGLEGDGVLGQGGVSKFQGERLPVEPDHRLAFGETLFAVELPLAEVQVA